MPLIRLLMHVDTAAGSGDRKDIRDWPEATCRALVDAECAEWYEPEATKPKRGKAAPAGGED